MAYLLLIGTRKGIFTATSEDRRSWRLSEPLTIDDEGWASVSAVYAVGVNPHSGRVLVGAEGSHFGPSVWSSDDLGRTWREPEQAPIAFPEDTDTSLIRTWQFAFGDDPNTVYAGVEPHALFRSSDGGESFQLVRGLWDHPHRANWFPGAGGACLHTVIPGRISAAGTDPRSMTVAMSTGGVYQSRDDGVSWQPANAGISAGFFPEDQQYPEYGQCVHKIAVDAAGDFYLQNHHGVYRTSDPAAGWTSIADGLPSDFGFAMVTHPHTPATAFNFSVVSQGVHLPPHNHLQAHRTDDGGASWHAITDGLPTDPYYSIVLRDAACTDDASTPGFYFGTRSGDVFSLVDGDTSWTTVAQHLPDVLCVRAVEV